MKGELLPIGARDAAKTRGLLFARDVETLLRELDSAPRLCLLCDAPGTIPRVFLDDDPGHAYGFVAAAWTCGACAFRSQAIRAVVNEALATIAVDGKEQ